MTFDDFIHRFPQKIKEVLALKERELQEAGVWTSHYGEEIIALYEDARKELGKYGERLEYRLRQDYLAKGRAIVVEGANGTLLDVDMGTIPFTTSSHVLAPQLLASLGLSRKHFTIIGVEKIYPTRVGKGPMPTFDAEFDGLVVPNAGEIGASTGRRRRAGYPDWVLTKYSAYINDCDGIILTRADVVQDTQLQNVPLKVCTAYKLPDGKVVDEVPCSLEGVQPVYASKSYSYRLWDGLCDLSRPEEVHEALKPLRAAFGRGGREGLPKDLQSLILARDEYVGCPTVAVSIGPARGEMVYTAKI